MELIALGIAAFATVTIGAVIAVKCSKAERRYNDELKALAKAKAEMTQFKKAELARLLAARKG